LPFNEAVELACSLLGDLLERKQLFRFAMLYARTHHTDYAYGVFAASPTREPWSTETISTGRAQANSPFSGAMQVRLTSMRVLKDFSN
jgi:hypothetical protein